MLIILDNIEQGSKSWFQEKLGKPSASNASKIITNEGKPSKQSESYMFELAAEIVTQKKEDGFRNSIMEEGISREEESRKLFEFINNVKVEKVGVIYKDEYKKFLCSPDGVINNEYGLELKNVLPKTQVKYLLNNNLPEEYFGQCQMSLYVTGFKYWMFMSYVPAMKPFIIRVERDEQFIEKLDKELNRFVQKLEVIVNKIN